MEENNKPLVVIESPFSANTRDMELKYKDYALLCLKDSLERGEAPFASHLLYTQVLNDNVPEERELGLNSGLAYLWVADKHVFYIDYGISEGMFQALQLTLDRINARTNHTRGVNVFPERVPILEFRKIL